MRLGNVFDAALGVSMTASSITAAAILRNVTPSVAIDQGTITGFTDASGNSVFLGIPFAETTGGENR